MHNCNAILINICKLQVHVLNISLSSSNQFFWRFLLEDIGPERQGSRAERREGQGRRETAAAQENTVVVVGIVVFRRGENASRTGKRG